MVVGVGEDAEDLVVQGAWDFLVEGVHLCGLVGAGTRGMGGPFLVPVEKRTVVHFEGVHDVG